MQSPGDSGVLYDLELIARAIRTFGLTSDPKEAGYILPDGRMLDFTGRADAGGKWNPETQSYTAKRRAGEPDWMAGRRDKDHRELGSLGIKSGSGYEMVHEFVDRTKAIRYMARTGGFEASFAPTDAQLRVVLRAHAQHFRGEPMAVDFTAPTGERMRSVEMERPTLQKLKTFFQEVSAPSLEGQRSLERLIDTANEIRMADGVFLPQGTELPNDDMVEDTDEDTAEAYKGLQQFIQAAMRGEDITKLMPKMRGALQWARRNESLALSANAGSDQRSQQPASRDQQGTINAKSERQRRVLDDVERARRQ